VLLDRRTVFIVNTEFTQNVPFWPASKLEEVCVTQRSGSFCSSLLSHAVPVFFSQKTRGSSIYDNEITKQISSARIG